MAHGIGYSEEQSPTLRSQAGGNSVPCILCQTPTYAAGESGRPNGQAAVYDTTQITSPANWSNPQPGSPSHPLCAGAHAPLLVEPVVRNEPGPSHWMPGSGCLHAEGENRPSRPGHLICFAQNQRDEVRNLGNRSCALSASAGMKQQAYCHRLWRQAGRNAGRLILQGCRRAQWQGAGVYRGKAAGAQVYRAPPDTDRMRTPTGFA